MNWMFANFASVIRSKWKYKLFLLQNLPLAFFVGLKIVELNELQSSVVVKMKWLNKNPFRSIYFAVLSMAAELSTGVLAFGNIYQRKPGVSMLVAKVEGEFYKKALGKIVFVCEDGKAIANIIDETIATGEGLTLICNSKGLNEAGEVVALFRFTWTFKRK